MYGSAVIYILITSGIRDPVQVSHIVLFYIELASHCWFLTFYFIELFIFIYFLCFIIIIMFYYFLCFIFIFYLSTCIYIILIIIT